MQSSGELKKKNTSASVLPLRDCGLAGLGVARALGPVKDQQVIPICDALLYLFPEEPWDLSKGRVRICGTLVLDKSPWDLNEPCKLIEHLLLLLCTEREVIKRFC